MVNLFPDDDVYDIDDTLRTGEVILVHDALEPTIKDLPWESEGSDLTPHTSVSSANFDDFVFSGIPPKGTIVVQWTESGDCQLVADSQVVPFDRSLHSGDIVKQKPDDAMSGVVISTTTTCTLYPVTTYKLASGATITGFAPAGETSAFSKVEPIQHRPTITDVSMADLRPGRDYSFEDLVIYGDWVGHILDVHSAYTLILHDRSVVEVVGLDEILIDEDEIQLGDIVQVKKGVLRTGRWIFGQYNPSLEPVATVVSIRTIEAEVAWLHSRDGSQQAPPDPNIDRLVFESDSFTVYDRSLSPHAPPDQLVTITEPDLIVGMQVQFRDLAAACEKHSSIVRLPRTETSGYDLNVFSLQRTQRRVRVLWQDLSVTEHQSIDLVPSDVADEEQSAWPGEIAVSNDMDPVLGLPGCYMPKKAGVIQSVNATSQMAVICWCPDARIQYSLEEESIGKPKADAEKMLVLASLGNCGAVSEEISLYEIDAPGDLNITRGDVVLLNKQTVESLSNIQGVKWLGEIVQDKLDGTLLIRLGAASPVTDITLRREQVTLAIRTHDLDMLDDANSFADSDDMSVDDYTSSEDGSDSMLSLNMREVTYQDANGQQLDENDVMNDEWESDSDGDEETPAQSDFQRLEIPEGLRWSDEEIESDIKDILPPPSKPTLMEVEQYRLLSDDAPADHQYSSKPFAGSGNLKRIQKEHRILQKSGALPPGVFVTSWESRLDLLRVLLIGPKDTPYADAPFVCDFWLGPSFPSGPPEAFFHSWTGDAACGGSGRVNPNLYEDGTICLSLLGTWSGEKQESWNAENSTVLQLIVSLLGLVLVREPYFNEAGYEHLVGTAGAKRPSILYSERVSIRALNFTLVALSAIEQKGKLAGLTGVADIIQLLFLGEGEPRLLEQICERARSILQRSEETQAESDGLTVLSQGACVPLRRVLTRLQALLTA